MLYKLNFERRGILGLKYWSRTVWNLVKSELKHSLPVWAAWYYIRAVVTLTLYLWCLRIIIRTSSYLTLAYQPMPRMRTPARCIVLHFQLLAIISLNVDVDGGGDSDSNTGQLCVALLSRLRWWRSESADCPWPWPYISVQSCTGLLNTPVHTVGIWQSNRRDVNNVRR